MDSFNFQNLETGTANQHTDVQCEMQQCQQIALLSFKLFFVRYDMDTLQKKRHRTLS